MAASAFIVYSKNKDRISQLDMTSATVNLVALTSTYTPDASVTGHSIYANLTNELTTSGGYTLGGVNLPTPIKTSIAGGWKFSTNQASWTASGAGIPAHRYYAMYLVGTVWGLVNPLIGYFIGDATPADIPLTTSGNPLTVTASANGWFDIT